MNKLMWKLIICFMTLLIFFIPIGKARASELDIGGTLEQILKYDPEISKYNAIESKYKFFLEKEFSLDSKLFISIDGNYDILNAQGTIDLDEAYTSIYLENTDLCIGKQIINWGTADGINPTNSINPLNIDSFTGGELKGEPVLAAQGIYYGEDIYLTGVLIFDFVPQDLSSYSGSNGLNLAETIDEPESSLENMEYALKAEKYIRGYDLKLSYFHGWEDLPALITSIDIDPISFQPVPESASINGEYRHVDRIGLATAGTLKDAGVWGELAYVIPEEIVLNNDNPLKQSFLMSANEPYIQTVFGADYTLDSGLSLEGQYVYYGNGSLINPYIEPGTELEISQYLMGHLAYQTGEKDSFELTTITNLNDYSILILPVYTHELSQSTDLKISPIFTIGEEGEDLTRLAREFNVSIKTSF